VSVGNAWKTAHSLLTTVPMDALILDFPPGGLSLGRFIDWLFGIPLIEKARAYDCLKQAIDRADINDDGYISINEVITLFKEISRTYRK